VWVGHKSSKLLWVFFIFLRLPSMLVWLIVLDPRSECSDCVAACGCGCCCGLGAIALNRAYSRSFEVFLTDPIGLGGSTGSTGLAGSIDSLIGSRT
jgi:hypothetical protein